MIRARAGAAKSLRNAVGNKKLSHKFMTKKNTKVIFEDGVNKRTEDMVGGMPLLKGEIINIHEGDEIARYEVVDKIIEAYFERGDQKINITYVLRKK